jgi:XPG N-terminal domain
MGITDLPTLLRESKKPTSKLSELNDSVLGVDTTIWLNKAIFSGAEFCYSLSQEPSIFYIDSMPSLFERNSIKLLFDLDGARDPLKADTNNAMKKSSDDAHSEMLDLISTKNTDNMRRINQLKKSSVYVREDIVASFVS